MLSASAVNNKKESKPPNRNLLKLKKGYGTKPYPSFFYLNILFIELVFYYKEVVFCYSAEWAYPIIWNIFKSCTWSDASVWVAYFWVVNVTTSFTFVFLHNVFFFICYYKYCRQS